MKYMTIIIFLLLTSCIRTEVTGVPDEIPADSVITKKPRPPLPPRDTTRIPISFNPSVEDWNETDIDL